LKLMMFFGYPMCVMCETTMFLEKYILGSRKHLI